MIDQFFAELGHLVDPGWWQSHWLLVFNVIMIDVVLAGDNAIVVGLAASRVAPELRAKVIFWGIAAAVIMRIGFAATTQQLLAVVGLTLAGGILLLWVCWKMYRQITTGNGHGGNPNGDGAHGNPSATQVDYHLGFWPAVTQVAIADISMSLDNVLAVAGAAKESVLVLVIGLVIAITLMAVASHYIAKLLVRYPGITWVGLAIIVYVALDMIFRGSHEVACKAYNIGCHESLWEWVLNGFR